MNMEAVAASISHELKQPLGSIALNCETAKLLLHRPQPEVQETLEILDETIIASERANEQLEGIRHLFGRMLRDEMQSISTTSWRGGCAFWQGI